MPRFVLEIGTEEIPARFLDDLQKGLVTVLEAELTANMVEFDGLKAYATPRRLVVEAMDMAPTQRQTEELLMGPPKRVAYDADGNPTKAAMGFAKTQGVELDQAFIETTDKGEYLAVRKMMGGGNVFELLPAICENVIAGQQFPKKMRWGARTFAFGRPLRWLLACLGDQFVDFEVAEVKSGNKTQGHRVMGFGPWEVANADEYFTVTKEKAGVVLSADDRRKTIVEQAEKIAAEAGGKMVMKESLLDEVCGLVEYPKVILGNIDPSFLEVPREVLLISMQSHQKSFGVEGPDGKLLPHFLTTLNLEPKDLDLVQKGWERVLKARLEDARFFWKTDLAGSLDAWMEELENVTYLGPLGSMGDKSRRLEVLCSYLAENVASDLEVDVARAGRIAKTDLVTEMVGEFADLQGIMGGIYAQKMGENETVAKAVAEQYLPAGQDSPVPDSMAGALLSIADKVDALIGCFGLGKVPTGANDPYALRRAVLGIIRIIIDKNLTLDLNGLLEEGFKAYGDIDWKLSKEEALPRLHEFIGLRLKNYFTAQGRQTLVVEAAIAADIKDVCALEKRIAALDPFSKEDDFEQAVLTFKRAANIILKQGQDHELTGAYNTAALQETQEKALAEKLEDVAPRFDALWIEADFPALLALLRELRPFVDDFFDNVMVMCEDADLRLNRLNLLKALVDRLGRLADFNALQV